MIDIFVNLKTGGLLNNWITETLFIEVVVYSIYINYSNSSNIRIKIMMTIVMQIVTIMVMMIIITIIIIIVVMIIIINIIVNISWEL